MDPSTEARHGQIAALAATGMRQREIARRMGCHFNTVYRALQRPEVQALAEAIQGQVFERASLLQAKRLEAMSVQIREERRRKREEKARKRALRQGQGTPLAREDSQLDPYASIREFLAQGQAQHSQAEEQGQEQDVSLPGTPEPQSPRRLAVREYLDQVAPWPD